MKNFKRKLCQEKINGLNTMLAKKMHLKSNAKKMKRKQIKKK